MLDGREGDHDVEPNPVGELFGHFVRNEGLDVRVLVVDPDVVEGGHQTSPLRDQDRLEPR